MNRLLSIFISIIGLIMVVVFSMNSILFVTHPDLSYGTEGMFHISLIFMLFALGILFFISKLNESLIMRSIDIDDSIFRIVFKHDIILLNLISILTLNLYFFVNKIESFIPYWVVLISVFVLIFTWILLIGLVNLKEKSIQRMLSNYISNIIFTAITVYLFIELFLYFNLN